MSAPTSSVSSNVEFDEFECLPFNEFIRGLEPALSSGAIKLLDSSWLIKTFADDDDTRSNSPTILCRRQDLPPTAFLTLHQIEAAHPDIQIVCLSYMWLHPSHPDPKGDVAHLLAEYLMAQNYHAAVFWDYASLHQHDNVKGICRTNTEEQLFQQGLNALALFYAHSGVEVYQVTKFPKNYPQGYDVPPHTNVAPYALRGWPFFESSLAKLCGNWQGLVDISSVPDGKRHEEQFTPYIPLMPHQFNAKLSTCSFTNGSKDRKIVGKLYDNYFVNQFCQQTGILKYFETNLVDEQAQELFKIFATYSFPKVKWIFLGGNKIGREGLLLLNRVISQSGNLPNLRELDLGCNRVGADGCSDESDYSVLAETTCFIEEISLSGIEMTDKGCHALLNAIDSSCALSIREMTPRLQRLNLSDNQITDDCVPRLCTLKRHCPDLEFIDLDNNPCSKNEIRFNNRGV